MQPQTGPACVLCSEVAHPFTKYKESRMTRATEEMVVAAMKKAVELKLIPAYCIGEDAYLKHWQDIEAILQAALNAS